MKQTTSALPMPPSPFAGNDWFDPLEQAVRDQVRGFIEQLLEEELEDALVAIDDEHAARTAAATGIGNASWSPPSAR